jgi:hypothetical protein
MLFMLQNGSPTPPWRTFDVVARSASICRAIRPVPHKVITIAKLNAA